MEKRREGSWGCLSWWDWNGGGHKVLRRRTRDFSLTEAGVMKCLQAAAYQRKGVGKAWAGGHICGGVCCLATGIGWDFQVLNCAGG